ncbi:MAG: cytochrome c oxidase accessory protein CcoG, partial [Gammaproteobacteria bacterium]|nr:cytochrome c oxidase accessory protein CcoG [Gammaproteobacteria bacterium]
LKRPRGLIRYSSLDENLGEPLPPLYKRPRVWVYTAILAMSFIGIIYGLSTLDALELKVLHARQPLFVLQSDGAIQNRYRLKVLNKTTEDMEVRVSATGPTGLLLVGAEQPIVARNGKVTSATVFIKVPRKNLREESEPVVFRIEATEQLEFSSERESIFIGPDS